MRREFLDRYSDGDSPLHRLGPRTKLLAALAIIAAVAAVPLRFWPAHAAIAAVVLALWALARLPAGYLIVRLVVFLPFVALLAAASPMAHGFERGWDVSARIMVGSSISFVTMLLLVNTTPVPRLLEAMRRLRVPGLLVATLAFLYRYAFVFRDELAKMRRARAARTFTSSKWRQWKTSSQMLGALLVRSFERAERVHAAMCARGWDGTVRTLDR